MIVFAEHIAMDLQVGTMGLAVQVGTRVSCDMWAWVNTLCGDDAASAWHLSFCAHVCNEEHRRRRR